MASVNLFRTFLRLHWMETHDILTDLEWMMVMAALEDDDETEDESGDEE